MALTEGSCTCSSDRCKVHVSAGREGWIDAVTSICRKCEIEHGLRWGHHDVGAEEGRQVQGDR